MEKLHSPEKTTGSTFGRNSLAIVLVYDPLVGQTEGAEKEPP